MSNQRVDTAERIGFHGPHYDGLEKVQALFGQSVSRMNRQFYEFVRTRLPSTHPELLVDIETTDRYIWPFGISFHYHGRTIDVLIPDMLDVQQSDETGSDRHVAFYYKGDKADEALLARFAERIAQSFLRSYANRYGEV